MSKVNLFGCRQPNPKESSREIVSLEKSHITYIYHLYDHGEGLYLSQEKSVNLEVNLKIINKQ